MADLTGMAVFAKVVETGSFSAAALELGLSKSAVSKQISSLEDHLGAQLLNRTTRRLNLTEVGTTFFERAARIVNEAEKAEELVTSQRAEPHGTLKVNVPMSFGIRHMAPALPSFMALYPDLKVDMVLDDRIVDLIEEGFDVAVRIARMPDSSLVARKLAPLRPIVCATPGYWRNNPPPLVPSDLAVHNCFIYSYLLKREEWHFNGPDGPLSVKISGSLRTNNGDAIRAVTLGHLGVFMGPSFIVDEDLRAGNLQVVLQNFEVTDVSIYAVYPNSRHLSAKVRAFIDFLVNRFAVLA